MKQVTALKFTCVGAFVATLGVGCASSGYARYDADRTDMDQDVGVSASADVGAGSSASISADADVDTDRSINVRNDSNAVVVQSDLDNDRNMDLDIDSNRNLSTVDTEGEERVTVSALSSSPETRATWVTRFPFYDMNKRFKTIDVYTFSVPGDIDVDLDDDNDREFSASTPAGSVFVEAAGGAGEVNGGRVIQHSPNPTR
jgi:hypothetical protein